MNILAADIGGTNSRFALFSSEPFALLDQVAIPSAAPDFAAVLDRLVALRPRMAPELAAIFALAVAGPVSDPDRAQLSNLPYAIDVKAVRESGGLAATLLINDFSAQAWACLTPAMDDALPLAPWGAEPGSRGFAFPPSDPARLHQPCALVGAGTGLGMAVLAAGGSGLAHPWRQMRIMPSEGGHAVFPFVGEEENAFAIYAAKRKKREYLRLDDIVTGPGLALLHAFLTGKDQAPARITAMPDFAQSRTCELFARFYGRICRNFALTSLPRAGLLVTGGLAANCPALVRHEAFRFELDNAPGEHRRLLRGIPFWHNGNQLSGLWGAAMAGRAALERTARY